MMAGISTPPTASSTNDLTLARVRDRRTVNEFLEQHHPLGGVTGWKACFGAEYEGYLVAVVVLGRPVSKYNDTGDELSITRFARRDDRPANTGSWLIARARKWAALEGYDRIAAHAGVAGNYGTVYEALGFTVAHVSQSRADDWTRREGRKSYGEYERRKWVYELGAARQMGVNTGGDA